MEQERTHKKDFLLPGSILIAALLISGALFYTTGKKDVRDMNAVVENQPTQVVGGSAKDVQPISKTDHKWGSDDAPIKIIGFTDLECPYCKDYHFVLKEVMNEMPGKIQFILRNFPLSGHTQAKQEAIATECVAELRGEDAFWKYVDKIFESTGSNDSLDLTLLPKFAVEVGVNKNDFESCAKSGKFDALLQNNLEDGMRAGLEGTPYSVIIAPNGQHLPLNGYLPAQEFKKVLEDILIQK